MKKITLLITCFCTAAFMTVLAVLTKQFPNLFSSMMTFPLEQIGWGLGALSKTGFMGNGAAAAVWFGISAIPAMIALRYRRSRETLPERAALYVLSGTVFLALYGMVNPRLFHLAIFEDFSESSKLIKAIFATSAWSVAILYITLRLIRLFRMGNKDQLLKYTQTMLYVLCAIFSGAAAISVTEGAMTFLDSGRAGVNIGFGVFRLIVGVIPYAFDVIIIMRATDLTDRVREEQQESIEEAAGPAADLTDRVREEQQEGIEEAAGRAADLNGGFREKQQKDIEEAAARVGSLCCLALGITTALTAVSNLLQIALMGFLSNISVTVDIPVISIAFTVMILLLSRLLIENKILRDDNRLFI